LGRVFISDSYSGFALAASATALALAALLTVTVVLLRAGRRWGAARLARHEGRWRESLLLATEMPEAELPPIPRSLLPAFAAYWNRVRASLKGAAAENLAVPLRRHGLEAPVLDMLGRRSMSLRLIAATTLGYLRARSAWDPLAVLARHPSPVLSSTAAQALLRIDPNAALDLLAADIVERDDWSLARLGSLFKELGPDAITPGLARIIASQPRRGVHRIVQLARFGQRPRMAAAVKDWLRTSADAEVLASALDYVEDTEALLQVRGAARHPAPHVRMAAARAVGRVGSRNELAILLELLRDPQESMQSHPAHALTGLHGIEPEEVEALQRGAHDPLAAEMLAHALADRASST